MHVTHTRPTTQFAIALQTPKRFLTLLQRRPIPRIARTQSIHPNPKLKSQPPSSLWAAGRTMPIPHARPHDSSERSEQLPSWSRWTPSGNLHHLPTVNLDRHGRFDHQQQTQRHSLPSPLPSTTSTPSTSTASSFSPFASSGTGSGSGFDTAWSSQILNGNFTQLPQVQTPTTHTHQHRGRELSLPGFQGLGSGFNPYPLVSAVRGEPWSTSGTTSTGTGGATIGDLLSNSPTPSHAHPHAPFSYPQPPSQYALAALSSNPPSRATSRATNDSSFASTHSTSQSHSRTRSTSNDGSSSSPRSIPGPPESPQPPATMYGALGGAFKSELVSHGAAAGSAFDFVPGEVDWGTAKDIVM